MSEPEQWRFQWPDGTWIRWNPQTQAWEKETPRADEPAAAQGADEPAAAPLLTDEAPVVVDEPAPEENVVMETDAAPEKDVAVEVDPYVAPRAEEPSSRGRRTMVADVLPPTEEPDRPGGSLWPTIFTGMVVGLAVGLLLLWNVIR